MRRGVIVLVLGIGLHLGLAADGSAQASPAAETPAWQPGTRHEVADGLTIAGSVRLRGEFKDDFKFDDSAPANDDEYLLYQARINLQYAHESFKLFIEGQHSGIAEDEYVDSEARPNIFRDDFDLHQGYLEVPVFKGENQTIIRAGRQKLSFGEQRLVGPLEWVNTARVFDAAVVSYGPCGKGDCVTTFSSRAVPVDPTGWNDWSESGNRMTDSDFHGAYAKFADLGAASSADAFYLLRHNSNVDDEVHTVGGRFYGKDTAWDWDGDLAYQFGDFGGLDQQAYATHLGGGYTVESLGQTRAGIAYNFATGDSDSTDGDHETFDNLYPTNHMYYGYMDLFSWQNLHNIEATLQRPAFEKGQVRVAYQGFWLDEPETDAWYNAGGGVVRAGAEGAGSYVGSEIDLTFKYPFLNGRIWGEIGYSHFFAGDFVEDTGSSQDADFFYIQTKMEI